MNIKTWEERAIVTATGVVTVRDAMEAEIDELRAALKAQPVQPAPLTDEQIWTKWCIANGAWTPNATYANVLAFARDLLSVRTGGAG